MQCFQFISEIFCANCSIIRKQGFPSSKGLLNCLHGREVLNWHYFKNRILLYFVVLSIPDQPHLPYLELVESHSCSARNTIFLFKSHLKSIKQVYSGIRDLTAEEAACAWSCARAQWKDSLWEPDKSWGKGKTKIYVRGPRINYPHPTHSVSK